MKALLIGLGLSVLGGAALAQSAPTATPTPAPPAIAPPAGGQAAAPKPGGPGDIYEGEIIQTPNGAYIVTPHPEDMGDAMDEGPHHPGGPEGPGGPPPHPPHPMPPSKAAHLRVKGPDVGLDLKCPDDEPVKACVDAIMPLLDKVAAHH